MVTAHKEQLAGNDATILNTARAELTALCDKLGVIIEDATDAVGPDAPADYTDAEADLYNKARGPLNSAMEKLRQVANEAEDALVSMDAQLEDFDGDHPERTRLTTSQRRQAEKESLGRSRKH